MGKQEAGAAISNAISSRDALYLSDSYGLLVDATHAQVLDLEKLFHPVFRAFAPNA